MPSFKQALDKANRLTRKKGKETSATKLLMLHFSCLEPTELFLKYEEEMPQKAYNNFFNGLNQYLEENIPVQQRAIRWQWAEINYFQQNSAE